MSTTLDQKPKVQIYRTTISADKLEKLQVKNANTEEDNNNGAEQPLTIYGIAIRTEAKQTLLLKTPWVKKKQEVWIGTMAHAPTIGSLSHGSFTKVRLNSAVKIPEL